MPERSVLHSSISAPAKDGAHPRSSDPLRLQGIDCGTCKTPSEQGSSSSGIARS